MAHPGEPGEPGERAAERQGLHQTSLTSFFQKRDQSGLPGTSPEGAAGSKVTGSKVAGTKKGQYAAVVPRPVEPRRASWSVGRHGACICRSAREEPRRRIVGLDLDGTLLVWRTASWPSRLVDYELWNPGVLATLRRAHDEGFKLVVFSNQGSIRSASEGRVATKAKQLVDWLAHAIERPLHAVLSTSKKSGFHKPAEKMLQVMVECCNGGVQVDAPASHFVGDSDGSEQDPQGGVDAGFARATGLEYHTPVDYFGKSSWELRGKSKSKRPKHSPKESPPLALEASKALRSGSIQGPILLILCGAQGSGKSFFSEQLLDRQGHWVHLSQDTIDGGQPGARCAVERAAGAALDRKQCVVVDRMHLNPQQRRHFVGIAEERGVPCHAVVLEAPRDTIVKRVRERTGHPSGFQGDEFVGLAVKSARSLVVPTYGENFALVSCSKTMEEADRLAQLYRRVLPHGGSKQDA